MSTKPVNSPNPPFVDYELATSGDGIAAGVITAVTLRDLFAAAALAGLCAAPLGALPDGELARAAYRHADAALKVRGEHDE